MPWTVVAFETTPNPNAIKCVLDHPIAALPRAYRAASEAGDDEIARSLFAIEGVTNLLMLHDFVTIGKAPDAQWPAIKRAVKRALRKAP
jgi:hypothetical protein